jgi:GxxExxY protein
MKAEMGQPLSQRVIGCALEVHRALGHGFLERVYENALAIEFGHSGIPFEQQCVLPVRYRSAIVGEYCCDLVIEGRLVVELKAMSSLSTTHEAQVLNYLKASGLRVGLLLNFGAPRLGIKRLALGHDEAVPV